MSMAIWPVEAGSLYVFVLSQSNNDDPEAFIFFLQESAPKH